MTYTPTKGGTLLLPSGPAGMHLFVTMTNRCENGFHLLISITSIKEGKAYDPACVFNGGEHPFIKQPSYAYYRLAEKRRSDALVNCVANGLFVPREDMPPSPFEALCAGIELSEFVAPWAVEYYRVNCNR